MHFVLEMIFLLNFVVYFTSGLSDPLVRIDIPRSTELTYNETRRILRGHEVGDTRPYMVYLRPASTAEKQIEALWICGGVIIDERYILTSAACIEDAKHFYVVSGTHKWVAPTVANNECVNNGAKKAVWKCVPKSYVFDGEAFDNIRWMINDIAVVKVEDDFNFNRRIKGCDFIPKKISYNNQSQDLEKPGTLASIAGWGSPDYFSDVLAQAPQRSVHNSEELLETDVEIITKKNCKKRWSERYHYIIDQFMVCGKDGMDTDAMSTACEQEVNCKELVYSDEAEDEAEDKPTRRKRRIPDPDKSSVLNGGSSIRRTKPISGGFCENDHGGPLVVGHGKTSMVIGIISASLVKDKTNQCYGPYLYTSVWNNRHLISCAIDKEMGLTCRRLLRATRTQMSETFFTWKSHPDGPARDEDYDSPAAEVKRKVFIDVPIETTPTPEPSQEVTTEEVTTEEVTTEEVTTEEVTTEEVTQAMNINETTTNPTTSDAKA